MYIHTNALPFLRAIVTKTNAILSQLKPSYIPNTRYFTHINFDTEDLPWDPEKPWPHAIVVDISIVPATEDVPERQEGWEANILELAGIGHLAH